MSEFERALEELARDLEGLKAAVIFETSGIELALWGEADFEAVTAEAAELWKAAAGAEALGGESLEGLSIQTTTGSWQVLPVGGDYLVALVAAPDVPPGKLRFCAVEWTRDHREAFA